MVIVCWSELPPLVLTQIYQQLSHNDRLNASAVCWNWRHPLFQPRFFKEVVFNVTRNHEPKNSFFLTSVSHLLESVVLAFNPLSLFGIHKTIQILQTLSSNSNCLKYLKFRPKHSTVIAPSSYGSTDYVADNFMEPLKELLACRRNSLIELDLGGLEFLSLQSNDMLQIIEKSEKVTSLALASVKHDPGYYYVKPIELVTLGRFTSLRKLSIDYENVNDDLLVQLQSLICLKSLHIHVHGLDVDEHPGTSDAAWAALTAKNSDLELHLTLIYAYEAIEVIHSHILSVHMPLSHLKVLFCEYLNYDALEYLSNYKQSLRSVIWVDKPYGDVANDEWQMDGQEEEREQDPLVMMAWRCKKLQELIVNGHAVDAHNVIGIARLRGADLKRLEISDLEWSPQLNEEISKQLGVTSWTPLGEHEYSDIFTWTNGGTGKEQLQDRYIMAMVQMDFENI